MRNFYNYSIKTNLWFSQGRVTFLINLYTVPNGPGYLTPKTDIEIGEQSDPRLVRPVRK